MPTNQNRTQERNRQHSSMFLLLRVTTKETEDTRETGECTSNNIDHQVNIIQLINIKNTQAERPFIACGNTNRSKSVTHNDTTNLVGDSVGSLKLATTHVLATDESDVAALTPGLAPGVTNKEVVLAGLSILAHTDDSNTVVEISTASLGIEDTARVELEGRVTSGDSDRENGLLELGLHGSAVELRKVVVVDDLDSRSARLALAVAASVRVVASEAATTIITQPTTSCIHIASIASFHYVRNNQLWTPLFWASEHNRVECLQRLIDARASVNASSDVQQTALIRAALWGHAECAQRLITANADAKIQDDFEVNALIKAASEGHAECVRLLLPLTADLEITDWQGNTALHSAAWNGHVGCLKLLIAAGANIEGNDQDRGTPLIWAACEGQFKSVRLLISAAADIEATSRDGSTVLMKAAESRQSRCMSLLIAANANIHATNDSGGNALIAAAAAGHVEGVRLLLNSKAKITVENDQGITALMRAAKAGHNECLQLLIDAMIAEQRNRRRRNDTSSYQSDRSSKKWRKRR